MEFTWSLKYTRVLARLPLLHKQPIAQYKWLENSEVHTVLLLPGVDCKFFKDTCPVFIEHVCNDHLSTCDRVVRRALRHFTD